MASSVPLRPVFQSSYCGACSDHNSQGGGEGTTVCVACKKNLSHASYAVEGVIHLMGKMPCNLGLIVYPKNPKQTFFTAIIAKSGDSRLGVFTVDV